MIFSGMPNQALTLQKLGGTARSDRAILQQVCGKAYHIVFRELDHNFLS